MSTFGDKSRAQSDVGKYFLAWKGKQTGPYTFDEVKAQLRDHSIGLMHEINAFGEWMPIEEFLARRQKDREEQHEQEAERMETVRRAEEGKLRADYEEKLERGYDEREELQKRVTDLEERLRKESLPQGPQQEWRTQPREWRSPNVQQRTSGLAITAFIMGLVNFVPLVNLVSWVLALIFGHVALSQIKNDPRLGGRGLAIAGLAITYALVGVGVIIGLLYGFNSSTFYRFK